MIFWFFVNYFKFLFFERNLGKSKKKKNRKEKLEEKTEKKRDTIRGKSKLFNLANPKDLGSSNIIKH